MVEFNQKDQRAKSKDQGLKRNNFLKIIGCIAFLILINILAQHFYTRFDFTKEKRFTLTQKTKDVLNQTKKDVIITEEPALSYKMTGGVIDLLFFVGDKYPDTVIKLYHQYIGKFAMMPFWSMGY
ncbi:MAG: hypothetical protein EOP00_36100, partial [Pedobacter sp.]